MIFAETKRLVLRALEKNELPRLVELLDVWDIARWLTVVPFPYTLRNAEEFYAEMEASYTEGKPQFFVMAAKADNLLMGGVGLHPPRNSDHSAGEVEIGYWLGQNYWGQGLMSEAVHTVVNIGFSRPDTAAIVATTAPGNKASQNVLRKAGLRDLGLAPRTYTALRGSDEVVKWRLTREEYEATTHE